MSELDWSSDDSVVVRPNSGVAIFTNDDGDIVIKAKDGDGYWGQDPFVIIPRLTGKAVAAAILAELKASP
jgi:hypothetical protein